MANHASVLRNGNSRQSNLGSIPASACRNQRSGLAVGVVSDGGRSRSVALRLWAESTVAALSEPRIKLLCPDPNVRARSEIILALIRKA